MLTVALITMVAIAGPPLGMGVGTCTSVQIMQGDCNVDNDGSSVTITEKRPGDESRSDDRSGGGNDGARPGEPRDGADDTGVTACDRTVDPLCRAGITYEVEVLREPTLADVASFAPASAPLVDEPNGVGVVGMPMNFVVDAQAHSETGELFDRPVTVRFAPASFVFVHGDGTSREATTGGSTWAELGRAQFSATATSHAYAARGTYSARAIVRYSAAVDFGDGWFPIPGFLEIPTAARSIEILEVRTALVDQTCLENPRGIGC